jgi:hypothetical protein
MHLNIIKKKMKQSWALKEIKAKKELENSKRNPLFKDKNKLSLS